MCSPPKGPHPEPIARLGLLDYPETGFEEVGRIGTVKSACGKSALAEKLERITGKNLLKSPAIRLSTETALVGHGAATPPGPSVSG